MTAAVLTGGVINLILFFVKLYVGLSSNSVAVYADSLNSLIDFAVCIAVSAGLMLSRAEPSRNYPFGKGRAEELSELMISLVILFSGLIFAYASFERLMYPVPVWYSSVYAAAIALTALIKLGLSFFFSAIYKKHGSDSIKGLATDSRLDFFVTLCTLVSLFLSNRVGFSADGAAGMIISVLLIAEGTKAFIKALGKATGKRNDRICSRAKELIEGDASVRCVKDLQFHSYGKTGVFTADIEHECTDMNEIGMLEKRLRDSIKKELDSKIYISFGGRNEK